MNRRECDILKLLMAKPFVNQRVLAEESRFSLGIVNRSLRNLCQAGYLDEDMQPTHAAIQKLNESAPKNAIILAAGFGMRMVPINMETSKGLLEVRGEVLIERLIRQLHEAGVKEIYIVVGFMKEKYEYLIDRFQVKLIVNSEYTVKNNLHSIKRAMEHLSNTYIIPCDIWCAVNPFSRYELYSWYMVGMRTSTDSNVRMNRKMELVKEERTREANLMIGIAYLLKKEAVVIKDKISRLCKDARYDNAFWEEALFQNGHMILQAKAVCSSEFIEINTYEQLRELDSNSNQLKSDAIMAIMEALKVKESEITNITVLKKGMTNRSFLFECKGHRYIMRIPGEGTNHLINRMQEAAVYNEIKEKGICDNYIYINPKNGYKITEFISRSRVCNPQSKDDIDKCMKKLRTFHEMKLKVKHDFDLFKQIEFYESLWTEEKSVYSDYTETKESVLSLKKYIDAHVKERVLTHIDAVPDNFLFYTDEQGKEKLLLIDWEYAGMQDPHVDVAMFCIYSFYDRQQADELINTYFKEGCSDETKIKIYCYIAVCGLLWSNWCEYKRGLGVDFGEYSLRQYRYAKEYYRIVCSMLGEKREQWDIR